MSIYLQSVADDQALLKEIFNFEKTNKVFFESVLPPRSSAYDHFETF